MNTFWSTQKGQALADVLIRELPKVEELADQMKKQQRALPKQEVISVASDEDAENLAARIANGGIRLCGTFGVHTQYVVIEKLEEKND